MIERSIPTQSEPRPAEWGALLDRLSATITTAHFDTESPSDPSGLKAAASDYTLGAVITTARQPLTHYTTERGLKGILDSGKIWATRTRDQSDRREVEYRHGLIWHATHTLPRFCRADRRFAAQLNWEHEHPTSSLDAFAVSFCEDDDSPRLWNEYGDEGRGFALTFDPRQWVVPKGVQFMEMKIEYRADVQELILGVFANAMRRAFRNALDLPSPPGRESLRTIYYDAFANMMIMCQAFKACHFRWEREWRAIYLEYEGQEHMSIPTQTRAGGVRYALIPLQSGRSSRIPLTAITRGPYAPLGEPELRSLLATQGLDDVRIRSSGCK